MVPRDLSGVSMAAVITSAQTDPPDVPRSNRKRPRNTSWLRKAEYHFPSAFSRSSSWTAAIRYLWSNPLPALPVIFSNAGFRNSIRPSTSVCTIPMGALWVSERKNASRSASDDKTSSRSSITVLKVSATWRISRTPVTSTGVVRTPRCLSVICRPRTSIGVISRRNTT